MATYPITAQGQNNASPMKQTVPNDPSAKLQWTPASGVTINGVTIGGGWPYSQPSQVGSSGVWATTYNNNSNGTYPYTLNASGGGKTSDIMLAETPEIQNNGGGGGGLPDDKPKKDKEDK